MERCARIKQRISSRVSLEYDEYHIHLAFLISAHPVSTMTGAAFVLSQPDSASESEDVDWSDSDAPQTIHVGPRDGIQLSEMGEASHRRQGRGMKERRVEWVGKPVVVGPEWMKMPL